MDILQYTFFQNALIGAFLASILCGFIGTYIVTRRLVFISGGITHASFGGIGIGVYAGLNPIFSAMAFAILSAFGVQWISRKKDVRKDSAIAMFWTLGMSVGIICCFLTPGFMPDLPSFLFGSILAIDSADLWLLGGLTLIVALLFTFLLRPIQNIAFDSTFARSQHLPVTAIEYLMMTLIAMTIVDGGHRTRHQPAYHSADDRQSLYQQLQEHDCRQHPAGMDRLPGGIICQLSAQRAFRRHHHIRQHHPLCPRQGI